MQSKTSHKTEKSVTTIQSQSQKWAEYNPLSQIKNKNVPIKIQKKIQKIQPLKESPTILKKQSKQTVMKQTLPINQIKKFTQPQQLQNKPLQPIKQTHNIRNEKDNSFRLISKKYPEQQTLKQEQKKQVTKIPQPAVQDFNILNSFMFNNPELLHMLDSTVSENNKIEKLNESMSSFRGSPLSLITEDSLQRQISLSKRRSECSQKTTQQDQKFKDLCIELQEGEKFT